MRRRRDHKGSVPGRLERFVEDDWHGDTQRERYDCWADACRMHHERHGWPGGAVEMFLLFHRTRRQMMGLTPEPVARRKHRPEP